MDTYIMKERFVIELTTNQERLFCIHILDIVNASCEDLDIRGVSHRGYFAATQILTATMSPTCP